MSGGFVAPITRAAALERVITNNVNKNVKSNAQRGQRKASVEASRHRPTIMMTGPTHTQLMPNWRKLFRSGQLQASRLVFDEKSPVTAGRTQFP